MRLAIPAFLLMSGCVLVTGTLRDEDCVPTWGDSCGCTEQCLTRRQIDRIQRAGVCDLDCGETTWDCFTDGQTCFVLPEDP